MKTKRFLCAAILLFCVTAAFAQKNYIIDEINFLSEDEIVRLNDLAQSVKDEFGQNVCIALVENYGGKKSTDFAEAAYKKYFGDADGILHVRGINEKYVALHRSGIDAQQIFSELKNIWQIYGAYDSGSSNYEMVESYIKEARTFFEKYFSKNYIIDEINFLSEDERFKLNSLAQSVKDEFGYNVCFAFVENYGGMEVDEFAKATYKSNFGNADGILYAYGDDEDYVFIYRTGVAAQQIFYKSENIDQLYDAFDSGDSNYEMVEAYIKEARTFFEKYFSKNYIYIIDEINFLSEDEIARLNDLAQSVKDEFGYNVCFAYVENYGDMFSDDFAKATYKRLFGNADGILYVRSSAHSYTQPVYRTGTAAKKIFAYSRNKNQLYDAFDSGGSNYEKVEAYINKARTFFASYFNDGMYSVPILETHDQVVDLGELLSAEEKNALEAKLDEIVARQNFDVVVVTVDDLNGLTREEFADDFYDYNSYGVDANGNGFGQDRDGVLLLVKMTGGVGNRDIHIGASGYGEKAFTDDGMDWILDRLIPKLEDGEYVEAFYDFANYSDAFLTQARTGKPYKGSFMPVRRDFGFIDHFFAIVIGLLILGPIIGGINVAKNKRALKSVSLGKNAADYEIPGSMNIVGRNDVFLYKTTTKVYNPPSSSSSSGGSSSRSHTSSSGRSHSGRGRSF